MMPVLSELPRVCACTCGPTSASGRLRACIGFVSECVSVRGSAGSPRDPHLTWDSRSSPLSRKNARDGSGQKTQVPRERKQKMGAPALSVHAILSTQFATRFIPLHLFIYSFIHRRSIHRHCVCCKQ
eukprot:GHVU01180844.1.p1 GENE.GHVU01180844.1~~GHVU01180844.1.p1  ORF type:complete len:127 (+),score=5.21 GHVU01180844.1:237-617(+)